MSDFSIVLSGQKVRLNLDNDYYGAEFWERIESMQYWPDTQWFISRFCDSRTDFLNIGAANGAMTLLAGICGANVNSYEPDPVIYSVLKNNIELNTHLSEKIFIHNSAISDRRQELTFSNRMNQDTAVSIMLKAKLKPLEPYKNFGSRWKSKCLICKAIGFTPLGDVQGGHGCKNCELKSTANKLRKDEKIAIRFMLDHGLKPLVSYKNSNAKWKSKCTKCKKIVYPTFGSVQFTDSKCEYCAGNKVD